MSDELAKIWSQLSANKEQTAVLCQRINDLCHEMQLLRATKENHATILTEHSAIIDCVRDNSRKVSEAVEELKFSINRIVGGIKVVACSTFLSFLVMIINYVKDMN